MQTTPDTPTSAATIQGIQLTVPAPFNTGHVVTENEAAALNQLLKENLRNNFAAKVRATTLEKYRETSGNKEAKSVDVPEDYELDDTTIESLQTELDEYVASYEFGVRQSRGDSTAKSPLEKEMYKVAGQLLRTALKAAGQKVKDIGGEDAFDAAVQTLVESNPKVKEEAERRLAATKEVAGINLADLGIAAKAE